MPTSRAPLISRLHGHAYTIGPRLVPIGRPKAPPVQHWARRLAEDGREVVLSGVLSERVDATTLAIVLHGCGGTPDSLYAVHAAQLLFERGHSVLRIAWRGADLRGEDLYHAAQTGDLHAAVSDPRFAKYARIWVLGYSLGGHASLHFAHENRDARVKAVAAVCPVLHLVETNRAIDAPERAFYRRYTLQGLIDGYAPMAKRGRAPTPFERVRKATTFRAYDALTVVPRYGFLSVDDYYTRMCASRIVDRIELPTLVVSARHDPMLPWQIADGVRPRFASAVSFRWAERGGHCTFPRDLALGEPGERGLLPQVLRWLERQ